ncbi:MAG: TIGR01212 family radical SAM protein, partial [Vicinamibacteria bacterium]
LDTTYPDYREPRVLELFRTARAAYFDDLKTQGRAPASPAAAPALRFFSRVLRERFGEPVRKVGLDAGFSCPHRRGPDRIGGCTYCDHRSFSPWAGVPPAPLRRQLEEGFAALRRKTGARLGLAYFQAYTNTLADVGHLEALYREALSFPGIVGIAIGTRPDCVPERVLDLLEKLHRETYLWLELGLESSHDRTLKRVNRGHDYASFVDAVERAHGRGLRLCAHVMLGLPGEGREDMMETADRLGRLRLDGVKIHHLHVIEGTPLAESYLRGEFKTLSEDEYVPLAADFLERLSPETVIHRLVGDCPEEILIAPRWTEPKSQVVQRILAELRRRGTRQGSYAAPA